MGETSKFVCVLILFILLFLVTASAPPGVRYVEQNCVTDKDCPKPARHNIRCR